MRILQVVPRYAPAWAFGGGVRMTFELARTWVRHGHEVTVYTSDQMDGSHRFPEATAELDGVRIQRFRNLSHRLASRWSFLFFYPKGMKQSLARVAGKFDVVHVAESRGRHNHWVAQQVGATQVPIVWSAYGGLAEGEGFRRVYRAMHDRVFDTRAIIRKSAALIAQTAHEAEIYQDFGATPEQIHQIPLAVNWDDCSNPPPRGEFRRKFGLGEREKVVLFLGRVHRTKGLQVLIPAFARAAQQHPDARLVVVGWDQGFLAEAKQLTAELKIGERVIFAGSLYGTERFGAYVDADIFALTPGTYEETSLAALEACACGKACVITHQCEIPGLDAAGGGIMTEYKVEAVADALDRALTGDHARVWGENARRMVKEKFTNDVVARMHEDLFARVAALAAKT